MIASPWTRTLGFGLMAALATVGCDGSGDVTVVGPDGGRRAAPTRSDSGFVSSVDVRPFEAGTFEARPDLPPPPMPNQMSKRIVGGRARLVGTHLSACSNQAMGSGGGDRWCAFTLPDQMIGRAQLWVLNVTKAIAGDVKCEEAPGSSVTDPKGADPNCMLLTKNLWTGQPDAGPAHPTAHRFDGDTLVYHANPPANLPNDIYEGPIFAWRPGWPAGKQFTGRKAVTCTGHFRTDVAVCIEDLKIAGDQIESFSLHAGKIGEGQMPKAATIYPSRPGSNASQWRASFTRDGNWFVYSTGGMRAAERETIYAYPIASVGDETKRITVATNASRWSISIDGKRIYFLKNYNYSTEGDPAGVLSMDTFPMPTAETALAMRVGFLQTLFDGTENDIGLAYYDNFVAGKANLKLMRDPTKPTDVRTVVSNTAGAVLSLDLKVAFYSKDFDEETGFADAHIIKTDATGGCVLQSNPTTDIFGSPFTRSAGLTFWVDNIDLVDGVGDAWVARTDGCANKRKFSTGMDFWFPVRDEGLIYSDEGQGGETAALKYARITDNTLGMPTEIYKQAGRVYALLPGFDAALYTITRGVNFDGLYLFSSFGWMRPAAAPDGGTN